MLRRITAGVVDAMLGYVFSRITIATGPIAAALMLVFGTNALTALGLSRSLAGGIVATVVTLGCLAGLVAFATYAIDWD